MTPPRSPVFGSSGYPRPGETCGSAPTTGVTSRPSEPMRRAGSSTSITRSGASAGMRRSSTTCSSSPEPFPRLRKICDKHLLLPALRKRARARMRGAAPGQGLLPHRNRGLRRAEPDLRTGHHAEETRAPAGRRHPVRLHSQEREAARFTLSSIPPVFELVSTLKKRRCGGPELLAYKNGRTWYDVKSADINLYIQQITGARFHREGLPNVERDRTGGGRRCACRVMPLRRKPVVRERSRAPCKEVSHYLGNTPAVCRASYIDPRVFDRYRSGWTIDPVIEELGAEAQFGELSTQGVIEQAVLDLIEDNRKADTIEKIA